VAQEIIVPASHNGRKLESYLAQKFPIGYVRKLFRKNAVRLNGKRAKELDLVQTGDRVALFLPFDATATGAKTRQARPAKLDILFENADIVVVNKPPGSAVHEAKRIAKTHTLLGFLESYFHQTRFKPSLVHRLDQDTSGVLLVAKTQEVAQEIRSRFEDAAVKKDYLCLVTGRPAQASGTIDIPLPGRDGNPVRALTRYRREASFFDTTLLRVIIETGRMHQIRLHFAKLGYPVVMDRQHGDFGFNKSFRKRTGLKRQFLHAARLALNLKGQSFCWEAPLPKDLRQTLEILESENRRVGSQRRPHLFRPPPRGGGR
jgi:23S rRNA pseudouridine955/2504/2580 synthase